ncbi:MAG: hypothetical protein CM1200mP28_03690 [Deltaproteobacteria bacterium]|nr:MAG: hypothetical protein CM1200mP28_03690 [Deltaproteobacteria bacterium]
MLSRIAGLYIPAKIGMVLSIYSDGFCVKIAKIMRAPEGLKSIMSILADTENYLKKNDLVTLQSN